MERRQRRRTEMAETIDHGACVEYKVKQNDADGVWLRLRAGDFGWCIGASSAAVCAGISRYDSPRGYWNYRVNIEPVEGAWQGNQYTRHGHQYEPAAAQLYKRLMPSNRDVRECGMCEPVPSANPNFNSGDQHFIAASIDRMGEHVDVEIKTSYYRLPDPALGVPREHIAQLHVQMAVRNRACTDYINVHFDRRSGKPKHYMLFRVYFSRAYWKWLHARLITFGMHLLNNGELGAPTEREIPYDINQHVPRVRCTPIRIVTS